ncbi:MAG: hypothetical protein ACK5PQ_03290 [Alphaproteobacteria bacterium]
MSYMFLSDASFWIFVSFVILAGASFSRVFTQLKKQLQIRQDTIARQITEVYSLYEEAKNLVKEEQAALKIAQKEVLDLEHEIEKNIQDIRLSHEHKIQHAVKRYEKELEHRMATLKSRYTNELVNRILENQYKAVEIYLKNNLDSSMRKSMIKNHLIQLQETQ